MSKRYEVERRHSKYYADLFGRLTKATPENLLIFEKERSNIEQGFTWARDNLGNDNEVAAILVNYTGYTVAILFLRLHPRNCIQWLEAGVSASRQTGFRRGEGARLGNLGSALNIKRRPNITSKG
jgi:hypothetical protein